ncbi:hypothetical protein I3U52_24390 [Mycobacteroides abscessus subsp. abscessus]|nr:hypothetical protein [Mycobacteroides abscessus]MBN7389249.1 hypothetical protein [Mycobacteroides abscessus subsp. abscessus]MBN7419041.1 hypothetical protein [Mycobacteroides abscessus subsp. abscessus]
MTTPEGMLEVSTRNHKMTVLRDDDLYRHVRFAEPGTSIWHFDLVTWPGHLVISGDIGGYHFARLPDMFEFFRKPVGYINAHYWAEKLCGPIRSMSFSADVFKRLVYGHFRHWCEWNDGPHWPLWSAICEGLLRYSDDYLGLFPKPYEHLVRDAWTQKTGELAEALGVPVYAANLGK